VTMAAARLFVLIPFLAMAFGCGSSEPSAAPVGEVMTSKAGEAQLKANGGKPLPKSVPSVDD
jgi:hypothetical protein